MKILMLNYEFPPLGGGAGNATAHIVRELALYPDLEIDVITSSVDTFRIEYPSPRVTLHFLDIGKGGSLHYQTGKDLLMYAWKAYRYSRRLISDKKFDLCHAFFGVPCGYIARKLGIPYIISLRGSDVPGHNPRFRWSDTLVFRWLSPRIWKRARAVVTNSGDLAVEARVLDDSIPYVTVPNGVDIDFFCPGTKQEGQTCTLLYVGRLAEVKGIRYLLKALSVLDPSVFRLVLVGGGGYRDTLLQQVRQLGIENRVEFRGIVEKQALRDVYTQADIFILPSLREGMSNTVLEAMASGLPVVVTDTGGARDLVGPGNGRVIPANDADALRKAVQEIWNLGFAKRLEFGARSRERVSQMSWSAVASQYHFLYESQSR